VISMKLEGKPLKISRDHDMTEYFQVIIDG
jgi:hypothetical protein